VPTATNDSSDWLTVQPPTPSDERPLIARQYPSGNRSRRLQFVAGVCGMRAAACGRGLAAVCWRIFCARDKRFSISPTDSPGIAPVARGHHSDAACQTLDPVVL
jgi:hypothetical protein